MFNTQFIGNTADNGGAINLTGIGTYESSFVNQLYLDNVLFNGNSATGLEGVWEKPLDLI